MTDSSARTAVVWSVLRAELARRGELAILDVGGGSGGFAVPLAQLGHTVTVVDPSPDALATLARRADAGGVAARITAVQGDADTLLDVVAPGGADLVLCHSVLEVVDDPAATLLVIGAALRVGGCASVLVANRAAAVLSRAIGAHFAEASSVLLAGAAREGGTRRFDREPLIGLLAAVGLRVEQAHGVRVVADLVPGAVADADGESLRQLELELSARSPYRDIATQLHLLARKT